MNGEHDGEFELALAFDTDSSEFARGVEIGILWERIQHGTEPEIVYLIHFENTEMLMRIAEASGMGFAAQDLDEYWTRVTLRRPANV